MEPARHADADARLAAQVRPVVCVLYGVPPVDRMAVYARRGPSQGAGWEMVQMIEVLSTPVPLYSVIVLGLSLASIVISTVAIWVGRGR